SPDPRSAYSQRVPFFDYHRMAEAYWNRLQDGASDVSWPGRPQYFALSSGTTGAEPKRIPVTEAQLSSIRTAGVRQLLSLKNFDLPAQLFEKQVLMLGSSTDLQEAGDYLEGEISGISASNIPGWFGSYYRPGPDIARIDDWDLRLEKISQQAPHWDIGALSGIPSWIQMMLERIIADHGLKHIHELWPDLTLYTTGGVAFEPYQAGFEQLLDHPLIYMDTYLASEGFFGFNARPDTKSMQLVLNHGVYYEFITFTPDNFDDQGLPTDRAEVVPIEQIEAGKDYALIISTCSGAWRYLIGDTIAFTDTERLEFRITGRTQGFLNVVGSQLSEQKLNDAIRHLEQEKDINVKEFTVGAQQVAGQWQHHWYLGLEGRLTETEAANLLDDFLQTRNKNYQVARTKSLKKVE
ncbi:MAG: GH3 auxin-responsive promoter family protein, partial [Bacteroidota bacterium]